ncbi:uncharacterized protein LOC118192442 [Stegodyphus dumicola]|uniref:uncharacterized protein LOC118192442 n=1 Tax=Stegodyphus dumicola TaxID=202533 RepID=UPI0015AAA236|nr:uncharacterized protein LOC118192442 [Stegodyphus dumicola]XP_035219301.1 uncharacterized protein LOC118192442 [Stegodyphus dumicola]XP_035219302.1 uncharacterized protein LOC118192442 [Stegodyphus dumicola]XP_035219303.1 uncharacterized protein LOC118192442 [Stegodyphus dumicola]
MYCALISHNPGKYMLDKESLAILSKKLFKKSKGQDWSESCELIDSYKFDVLSCQAYKLIKARYTVSNAALSDFHKKCVSNATSQKLMNLYVLDMEKKLKKEDSKELKQQPPRQASFLPY